jgi:hypothetical protein
VGAKICSYPGNPGFVDGPETAVVPEVCRDFPYSMKTTVHMVNWRRPEQLRSMFLEFIVALVAMKSARIIKIIFHLHFFPSDPFNMRCAYSKIQNQELFFCEIPIY